MEVIRKYNCLVIGVEPIPELVVAMPKHENSMLEPAAITGGESRVRIHVNPTSCASIGIMEEGATTVEVAGLTFEQLLIKHNVDRVGLLKVDIEGAEIPLLLASSDDVLRSVDQITVEYHDFIDTNLRVPVQQADARLRHLGFQRIKFSLDNTDVLYLHPSVRLKPAQVAATVGQYKFARGAVRRARRLASR